MDPCGPDSYYYWIRWTSRWLTLHILDVFAELFLVILSSFLLGMEGHSFWRGESRS